MMPAAPGKLLTLNVALTAWGLIRAGLMNTEIAERFGVSDSRISEIRTGKRWANVLLEAPKP